jgi:hypothetical protein
MTYDLYIPAIVQKDVKGRVLFAQPLQAVTLPIPSLVEWNSRVYRHVYERRA